MSNRNTINTARTILVLIAITVPVTTSQAAPVSETDAVAVASLWLWTEINSSHMDLSEAECVAYLDRLAAPRVYFLLAADVWLEHPPVDEQVLAYAVAYEPGGFVIVTADDRLEPVLAFGAEAPLRTDPVPENYMRAFLARNLPARWQHLRAQLGAGQQVTTHPTWVELRWLLTHPGAYFDPLDDPDTVYVLWDTALWGQGWPYNTEVVAHNGGHECPTGCTATAMAIQMRFHSWPLVGRGSHNYCDTWGTLQYCHSANFGTTTYDWANMPTGVLNQENPDVAQLMYHCGVAVEMDYEAGVSGAWPSVSATNAFFRYHGTLEVTSGHEGPLIDSVLAGLPTMISSTGHTVVVDGYRDSPSPYFHMNCGWNGGNNDWYNLNHVPGGDPTINRSYPYSSPNNYIFVDGANSGYENGTLESPYDTVHEGYDDVPSGGRLCIKAGSYTGSGNVPITFTTPMTVTSYEGTATIGGP